jgi:hypothetical protein
MNEPRVADCLPHDGQARSSLRISRSVWFIAQVCSYVFPPPPHSSGGSGTVERLRKKSEKAKEARLRKMQWAGIKRVPILLLGVGHGTEPQSFTNEDAANSLLQIRR